MYRIITAAFLFLLLCIQCANAQTLEPQVSLSNQKFKWEVGADMLWLLRKKPDKSIYESISSNVSPFTVMLRVHSEAGYAYRVRVGANYQELLNSRTVNSKTSSGKIQYAIKSDMEIFLGVGKEWEKQVGKFRFFYGSDVFLGYSSYKTTMNSSGQEFNGRKTSVGVSPLIGVQYFILPRLSISTETHLDLAYNRDRTIMYVDGEREAGGIQRDYGFFKADFQPLALINLNYHF